MPAPGTRSPTVKQLSTSSSQKEEERSAWRTKYGGAWSGVHRGVHPGLSSWIWVCYGCWLGYECDPASCDDIKRIEWLQDTLRMMDSTCANLYTFHRVHRCLLTFHYRTHARFLPHCFHFCTSFLHHHCKFISLHWFSIQSLLLSAHRGPNMRD